MRKVLIPTKLDKFAADWLIERNYNVVLDAATPIADLFKANPDAFPGTVADVSAMIRMAITGKTNSPDLYSVMQVLGTDRCKARIEKAIASL